MGTLIYLSVGNLELDWGKNYAFIDHSPLYQAGDLAQVPYMYVKEDSEYMDENGEYHWELYSEQKEALSSPLHKVIDRVRLLGYTLETAWKELECALSYSYIVSPESIFDQLQKALMTVDVAKLDPDYGEGGEDFGKFFRREVGPRLGFDDKSDLLSNCAVEIENLSAYSILTLLAENPLARDLPVIWRFKDHEESGWASRGDYISSLIPDNKFLIVTEGSSDALILKHAFSLLMPHVADFFNFVDMQEGYPFSGTGNLYRFIQGLISISIQNKVIVLFDNDAEGVASFLRCRSLNVPENMKILKLPDLKEFEFFKTIGPSGEALANINGKGAAIECYLDLGQDPIVRWSSFNHMANAYQGELTKKDRYKHAFLNQKELEPTYDYRRLRVVLENIVKESGAMREAIEIKSYKKIIAKEN